MDREQKKSAYGPYPGQSRLGPNLWQGPRFDRRGYGLTIGTPFAPGAAGLAFPQVHERTRLEHQGPRKGNRDVGHLSAKFGYGSRNVPGRSRKQIIGKGAADTFGRRTDKGPGPGGLRAIER